MKSELTSIPLFEAPFAPDDGAMAARLLKTASFSAEQDKRIDRTARRLIAAIRAGDDRFGGQHHVVRSSREIGGPGRAEDHQPLGSRAVRGQIAVRVANHQDLGAGGAIVQCCWNTAARQARAKAAGLDERGCDAHPDGLAHRHRVSNRRKPPVTADFIVRGRRPPTVQEISSGKLRPGIPDSQLDPGPATPPIREP